MTQVLKYIKGINAIKICNFLGAILTLLISFYLMCGNVIFGSEPLAKSGFGLNLVLFVGDLLCILFLIFINTYRNNYRPSIPLIIGLVTILISNFVTLIIFNQYTHLQHVMPDGTINDFVYVLTLKDKFCYFFQFFGVLVVAFLLIDLLPKNMEGLSTIYALCFGIAVFAFVALIYSYITEANYYTTFFFKIFHKDDHFIHATSFFPNKNSFAIYLFMGMVSCLFLQQRKGHWFWFIPATYLLLAIFMTFCKALIIIAPAFFFGFLLYRGILTLKHHVLRNVVVTLCILAILGCLVIFIVNANQVIPGFYDYLYKIFIKSGDDTFDLRLQLWKGAIELLNKFNWFTGLGFHNANFLLFQYCNIPIVEGGYTSTQVHNVYLEMLLDGGVFFALFFVLALTMVIILIIRVFKENKSIVLFDIVLLVCLLALGVIESGSFILSATCDYAFLSALIFVPLVQMFHKRKLERIELEKDCLLT